MRESGHKPWLPVVGIGTVAFAVVLVVAQVALDAYAPDRADLHLAVLGGWVAVWIAVIVILRHG